MNQVFYPHTNTPLAPEQLAMEANALYKRPHFTAYDFKGSDSRIADAGHCYCNGDGEFELLPITHPYVVEGLKRYMVCRKCGALSHL